MKLLVPGGTVFLGRYIVEAARSAGHDVTLFNRGKSGPGIFPCLEHIAGDRSSDMGGLRGRRWDAVIDTCGYAPRMVRRSTEFLRNQATHYTFISTVSVYKDWAPAQQRVSIDETASASSEKRAC